MTFFLTMRKLQNPEHSLHHLYVPYYLQIQKYSDLEYLLRLKQLTLTIKIIFTLEHLQIDHL